VNNTYFNINLFKIRVNDNENYDDKSTKYNKHLNKIKNKIPVDLLKYFGKDFFHDGSILSININNNIKIIDFLIECPNIRYYKNKTEFEYFSLNFICRFINVVFFEIKSFKSDKYNDPLTFNDPIPVFMHSEINSLSDLLKSYNNIYRSHQ